MIHDKAVMLMMRTTRTKKEIVYMVIKNRIVLTMLVLSIALTANAACESVERDLPDTASAGEAITVSLTQDGFLLNVVEVTEVLPVGFTYMSGSFTGSHSSTYHPSNNTLIMYLAGGDEVTAKYTVTAGTFEQIDDAQFSGAYQGIVGTTEVSGPVTGDSELTPVEPTPATYDLNGDGTITPVDALIALEMACGNCAPDGDADVSGDGKVTALDALMLMQVAANNISI
jgi:hypothetical protein